MQVTIPSRGHARGIYLRDVSELGGPLTIGVDVKPLFAHAASPSASEVEEPLKPSTAFHVPSTDRPRPSTGLPSGRGGARL